MILIFWTRAFIGDELFDNAQKPTTKTRNKGSTKYSHLFFACLPAPLNLVFLFNRGSFVLSWLKIPTIGFG